jgi:phosphoribosyl 1,2-cyclic phosphodiesterase
VPGYLDKHFTRDYLRLNTIATEKFSSLCTRVTLAKRITTIHSKPSMGVPGGLMNRIKFLGTAGARYVVSKQLRASGGLFLELDGHSIIVDPGPGCLVKLATSRPKIDPTEIDIIILTHKHIDHSNDVNALIDGMTGGGFRKKGMLIAPSDALEGDPVVLRYLRDYLDEIIVTEEGTSLHMGGLRIEAPLKMKHTVETFGLRFHTSSGTVSHVPDTAYFPDIARSLEADITILNVVLAENKGGIFHLDIVDSKRILSEMRPRIGILTHFGMSLIKRKPWELVQEMEKELGLTVLAARDGMSIDMEEVLCKDRQE